MRQILAINRALYRATRNQAREGLGNNVSLFRTAIGAVIACAVAFQMVVLVAGRSVASAVAENPSLAGYYTLLMLLAHVCIVSLLAACLAMILAGTSETFGNVLRTLPVHPTIGNVAADVPILVACALASLTSVPGFAYTLLITVGILKAVSATTAFILLVIAASTFSVAVLRTCAMAVERLPYARRGIGGAVGLGLVVTGSLCVFYYAVLHAGPNTVRDTSEGFAEDLVDGAVYPILVAIAAAVMASVAWVASAFPRVLVSQLLSPSLAGRLLTSRGSDAIRQSGRGRVRLEIVQLLRNPIVGMAVALMAFVLAIIGPLRLLTGFFGDLALLGIVVNLTALVSVISYGATYRHHWIYRTAGPGPSSWLRYKWLGTSVLAVTMAAIALAGTLLLSSDTALNVDVLTYGTLLFASGMCVGGLLPVDNKLVMLVDLMLAAVVTFVVAYVLNQSAPGLPGLLAAVALLAGVYLLYRRVVVPRETRQLAF